MTDESLQIHFALAQPFAGKQGRVFPFHPVHYRRSAARQVPPARRQRLSLLLVLLVNGACLLGIGRWLYQSVRPTLAQESGKYLQAGHSSPKFNFNSATKPETKDVSIEVPPPPVLPAIAAEPLLHTEETVDPVDPPDAEWDPILAYSDTLAPHRGDTPMLRNWKLFELAALLAIAAPSPIVLAGGEGKETEKAILERVEKMVKDLKAQVAEVKTQVNSMSGSLGNVAKEVAELKGEITPLKGITLKIESLNSSFGGLKAELERFKSASSMDKIGLEDVKERLANIEKALARLQQTEMRTSFSPAATAFGKIMLINNYTDRLLFQINDKQFFVEPGTSQPIENVPAGPFTYRVMSPNHGWLAQHNRVLEPNRTFTLNATLP
jgi:hypothetical protein